ncbi:MAG: HAD family hydrolase [Microgenomates group bacterium]
MRYKYFLFDWDGSLANTLSDWFRVHKKILLNNGIKVADEVVCQETFGKLDVGELGITNVEKYLDEIEQEIRPSLDGAVLNPGVREILETIKKSGGKVGIMTDSKKKWVKHALKNNGLKELVDVFLGREDVTERKPDPEVIFKSLEYMGGKIGETLVTGDNWKDIQAARAAGVESCLYFPKRYEEFYKREDQLRLGATYVIDDFTELRPIADL